MYDLGVLGAGPGGYVAAIRAAQKGLKVALVEKETIGGTCLNRGCIPTKSFLSDLKTLEEARASQVLTGVEGLGLDIHQMVKRKDKVVGMQVRGLEGIIQSYGIHVEQGTGELITPDSIVVTGKDGANRELKARSIILAGGSKVAVPPFIQVDGETVITTDEALNPVRIPKAMVIIGGGVVGVEFATIYQTLGTNVTIVEMLDDIIVGEDLEVRNRLRATMQQMGIEIHLKSKVENVECRDQDALLTFKNSSNAVQHIGADKVLVATGRTPNLEGIAAERIGLKTKGSFISVNSKMETGIPGVYAIGDLIGGWMLAHAASAEGEAAVSNILGKNRTINQNLVPRCIYTSPEVGSVGMTQEAAENCGRSVKIGQYDYKFSGKAHAMDRPDGFVKIIADEENGEILGASIMGEHATDLIGEVQLAMTVEAAIEDLWDVIKAHPTLGECVTEASLAWDNKTIHGPKGV